MSLLQIGTVRERLWLLAHDDRRDLEPRLHSSVLEIGLIAATLVDLLLADRIVVAGGYVYRGAPGHRRTAPAVLDPITAGVLESVTEETPRLTDMLRAGNADPPAGEHHPYVRLYQRTHAALVAAGIIVEQRRKLRASRFQLADPAGLAWNKRQISHRLVCHDRPGGTTIDGLCALVGALNLHTTLVTPYEPHEAGQILHTITQQIPARPGPTSPLAVIPHLPDRVRDAVGGLAAATS